MTLLSVFFAVNINIEALKSHVFAIRFSLKDRDNKILPKTNKTKGNNNRLSAVSELCSFYCLLETCARVLIKMLYSKTINTCLCAVFSKWKGSLALTVSSIRNIEKNLGVLVNFFLFVYKSVFQGGIAKFRHFSGAGNENNWKLAASFTFSFSSNRGRVG